MCACMPLCLCAIDMYTFHVARVIHDFQDPLTSNFDRCYIAKHFGCYAAALAQWHNTKGTLQNSITVKSALYLVTNFRKFTKFNNNQNIIVVSFLFVLCHEGDCCLGAEMFDYNFYRNWRL